MLRSIKPMAVVILSLLLWSSAALAASVHLQLEGALLTLGGGPAPDGQYPMAFRFYAAQVGGESLFQELSLGVVVKNSVFGFVVGLDAKNPMDEALYAQSQAKWVGVQVGTDPELPRVELTAVPYAIRSAVAAQAQGLACSGCVKAGALAISAVTTENLADGAVTTDKIAAAAVTAAAVGFNYATSNAKGGDATKALVALDIQCSGCVGSAEISAGAVGTLQLADGAVTKGKVSATFAADLDLATKTSLAKVATSGLYVDLAGGPDLAPYAKLAAANQWTLQQTLKGGADFAKTQALNFRYQTADADPAVCDASAVGMVYFNTKTASLMLCDGKSFKVVAYLVDYGTQNNPAISCKDLLNKNPQAQSGLYYIKPAGLAFQVYCNMSLDGGGWTVLAYAPTHATGLTFSLGADLGTPGDLGKGWTQMATGKGVATPWFQTFRGWYEYLEDQPNIPQTGKLFDVSVDYNSKVGDKTLSDLVANQMGAVWTVATSEGVTCSQWYSLFSQFWNTLAQGAAGGKGGHPYCGFYDPGLSSEGFCAQAYPVNQCNRAGYGKFVWAWYMVR